MAIPFVCPYDGLVPLDAGAPDRRACDTAPASAIFTVEQHRPGLAEPGPRARAQRLPLSTLGRTCSWDCIAHARRRGARQCVCGYEAGARSFDGSAAGIGGGIAMRSTTTEMGNVATGGPGLSVRVLRDRDGIDLARPGANGRHAMELVGHR